MKTSPPVGSWEQTCLCSSGGIVVFLPFLRGWQLILWSSVHSPQHSSTCLVCALPKVGLMCLKKQNRTLSSVVPHRLCGKQFFSLHCTGEQQWLTLAGNFLTEERQIDCFQEESGLF